MEDIKGYSEAFWKNWNQIENGHKHIERIEKGETELKKRKEIDLAIEDKFDLLRGAFLQQTNM